MFCGTCGSVCCYADDTSYTCSASDPSVLSEQLSNQFKVFSDFLISNRLKLNDDKTHLMVLTTSQKRRRAGEDLDVKIITPSKHVSPTPVEYLLGSWIHQDLKWSEHLQDNKDSLIKSLISRINALKIIGRVAPFKTRKMIADGIFTSKLSYLIALWGGADKYLIKSRLLKLLQSWIGILLLCSTSPSVDS